MAEFNMTLTNKGAALLAKCIAGQELRFIAVCMGDGTKSGSSADRSALVSQKIRLPVNKITVRDAAATMRAILSFANITEGFYWREIGLYALDVPSGTEVLYSYGNAGDKSDWIPAGGATTLDEKKINVTAMTSTAATVTAVIDGSLIYATQDDLNAKADTDLGNVSDEVFKAKAEQAGAGGVPPELVDKLVYAGDPTQDEPIALPVDADTLEGKTAAEIAAMSDSAGSAAKVDKKLGTHAADTTKHITAAERTEWNGKQAKLTFDTVPTAGSANPVTSGGVNAALDTKGAPYRFTMTIPTAGWVTATKGVTQVISVPGVTAAMCPTVDVVQSADAAAAVLQLEGWGCVSRMVTGAGNVTVFCYDGAPQVAVPVQLVGVM